MVTMNHDSSKRNRRAVKTAVIYARFSCSKQREASIEDQVRVCHEWCQRNGYAIVAEYSDHAMSGRTDERPDFQRMISNAGESDIVLVYMMDRFSRNEYDAPIYKRELERHGVRLVSALEAIPDSPEGVIYEKLLEGLAACESMKTSVRTKRGMKGNALKCMHNGVKVFGYSFGHDGRYVVNEQEAPLVRECFEHRLNGDSINSIAANLASRGVKTYTGRPCSGTMVCAMLHNEKYIGTYRWGDVEIPNGMPCIVDKETFLSVQGVKGRKVRANESWGTFPLSGKAVCAGCGHNLVGVSGRNHAEVKYEYYRCKHCKLVRPVRADWLESEIASHLREVLSNRKESLRVATLVAKSEKAGEIERRKSRANELLDEAQTGLSNILKAVEEGILAPGTKERIAELEAQRDRAELDLRMIKEERTFSEEDFADFLQCGRSLNDAALLKAFVWQILVSDEEVTVTLNYENKKGEPEILSLVRPDSVWLPIGKSGRTFMAYSTGVVMIRFQR
jgi:site-specific DNA recombinase